jgi:adenosine deaminase
MQHEATFNLDYQGYYPIELDYNTDARTLTLHLDALDNATPRFRHNIRKLLSITTNDDAGIEKIVDTHKKEITFTNISEPFQLKIGEGRLIAELGVEDDTLKTTHHIPLTVTQKRMIGTYHLSKINSLHIGQHTDATNYEETLKHAQKAIIGDFHTHSSGAISAEGLLKIAMDYKADYPVHLLKEIGIRITPDRKKEAGTQMRERIPFPPLEPQDLADEVEYFPISALTDQERVTLRRAMSLPDSEIATYYEMEVPAYQTRNPLTKNPKLLKDSIKQAAEEAAKQGLDFIELSYTSLEKPELFKAVHEAIREAEQDDATKGITIRLKYGIPRTFSEKKFRELLAKAKHITKSPYVTGIDILGYEDDHSDSFETELAEFASWAKQNDPELMISVHAGENDKNESNVRRALQLAKDHDITVRIGHGIHGLHNEETLALAEELAKNNPPRIYVESNPDSNIALNNLMDPNDLALSNFIDHKIPFVPGSDSYGHYQTSKIELATSFIDAGLGAKGFDTMKQHQKDLYARLEQHSKEKACRISNWNSADGLKTFIADTQEKIAAVPETRKIKASTPSIDGIKNALEAQGVKLVESATNLPDALKNKKPVTLVGASGASWKRIDKTQQRAVALSYDMLVHALDPEKVYFAQGRSKYSGVSKVMDQAITRVNGEAQKEGKEGFINLGLQADITFSKEAPDAYSHLDYMLQVPARTEIADYIVNHTVNNKGILVAAGGAAYTRDIILKADLRMKQESKGTLFVMSGPQGASSDKARGLSDGYCFKQGKELLQKIYDRHPGYFKEEVKQAFEKNGQEDTLKKLYEQAEGRIAWDYPKPEPSAEDQTITGAKTLPDIKKGKTS